MSNLQNIDNFNDINNAEMSTNLKSDTYEKRTKITAAISKPISGTFRDTSNTRIRNFHINTVVVHISKRQQIRIYCSNKQNTE